MGQRMFTKPRYAAQCLRGHTSSTRLFALSAAIEEEDLVSQTRQKQRGVRTREAAADNSDPHALTILVNPGAGPSFSISVRHGKKRLEATHCGVLRVRSHGSAAVVVVV